MALTWRCTGAINLFCMVIDESLHTNSAYIEHVAARHTRSTATPLGSASTDTAAAAADAGG